MRRIGGIMETTASVYELTEAVSKLTDQGKLITSQFIKSLLENGYSNSPIKNAWTGYHRGIEKKGNVIFPEWR
jgi:hypothetical protein